jgi:hypothetical protein
MIEIDGIKYFTLTEVSQMFVKSKQTVSNWRRSGRLKSKRISQRQHLFSEIAIKDFIEGENYE